jgi:hypothetical protein
MKAWFKYGGYRKRMQFAAALVLVIDAIAVDANIAVGAADC